MKVKNSPQEVAGVVIAANAILAFAFATGHFLTEPLTSMGDVQRVSVGATITRVHVALGEPDEQKDVSDPQAPGYGHHVEIYRITGGDKAYFVYRDDVLSYVSVRDQGNHTVYEKEPAAAAPD